MASKVPRMLCAALVSVSSAVLAPVITAASLLPVITTVNVPTLSVPFDILIVYLIVSVAVWPAANCWMVRYVGGVVVDLPVGADPDMCAESTGISVCNPGRNRAVLIQEIGVIGCERLVGGHKRIVVAGHAIIYRVKGGLGAAAAFRKNGGNIELREERILAPVCTFIFAAAPELENVTVEPETVVVAITRLLLRSRGGANDLKFVFGCLCPRRREQLLSIFELARPFLRRTIQ